MISSREHASRDVFSRPEGQSESPNGGQRGQVTVLFALLLPLLLMLGAIVLSLGNWYAHARQLQTKADAAAFAGGGVWGFPCGPDVDALIEAEARKYVGDHTTADGTIVTGSYNPQVGGVGADQLYVTLNQAQYWSGNFSAPDFSDPAAPVCESKVLDVKATEADAPLIWGLLPIFPDIKRKARVQIEEVEGLTGLLPIAVRLPQPLSAAAAFYDEETRDILDVRYFRQVCTPAVPGCIFGMPPGLGQWTTEPAAGDTTGSWARFPVARTTGVVVATSVRPACGSGSPPARAPCLEDSGWSGRPIDDFCRQASGAVQCYDADGSGGAQAVRSGVQFIRGYGSAATATGPPQVGMAYLDNTPMLNCGAYFNSVPSQCRVRLNVVVDLGDLQGSYPPPLGIGLEPLRASDVQVRYRVVRADATSLCNYGPQCDLLPGSATGHDVTFSTTGTSSSPHVPVTPSSRGNAVALEIRIRNAVNASDPDCTGDYNDNCRWFHTATTVSESVPPTDAAILAAPIQRSFMGDVDRTGPLKWLRLTVDKDCVLTTLTDRVIGQTLAPPVQDAASQPKDAERCYVVEMGMAGGLARDQDEPPIALNLGTGSSQRAVIDCDPNIANLKSEIVTGCQWPSYSANKFDTSPLCPGTAGFFNTPKPEPFATWPPFRCVLTQTSANPQQVVQGFNDRIFRDPNSPSCPNDVPRSDPTFQWGRNYWHRENNANNDDMTFAWDGQGPPGPDGDRKGNTIRSGDPRLVTLFFTTYDSFTSPGNEVYPIVGFGNFYVTGYGTTQNGNWQGGGPDDPCDSGNDGDLNNGNGNEPPPDLDYARNTTWVWGHFVKDVTPAPFTTGGSGVICNPEASFMPCVAVLVE